MFAFKGDMKNRQIVTVEFEQSLFNQTVNTCRVPTLEHANQALAQVPPPKLLGPFTTEDAGTQVV